MLIEIVIPVSIGIEEVIAAIERVSKVKVMKSPSTQECDDCIQLIIKGNQHDAYDDLHKQNIDDILWNHCAGIHPMLLNIPPVRNDVIETKSRVSGYVMKKLLREGATSSVFECVHDNNFSLPLAMKRIDKADVDSFRGIQALNDEIKILSTLQHPHIIEVIEIIHTSSFLYMITNKGGQDLFDFMSKFPYGISEVHIRVIFRALLESVHYCHSKSIAHRDIKPENVLIDVDVDGCICNSLYMCDFGLAVQCEDNMLLSDFIGSQGFFAPEMILVGEYNPLQADMWSLGVILLELILGHEGMQVHWMPGYADDVLMERDHFLESLLKVLSMIPNILLQREISTELADFLHQLLVIDQNQRLKTVDALAHSWLESLRGQ